MLLAALQGKSLAAVVLAERPSVVIRLRAAELLAFTVGR
jgi:hypothetical protein